MFVLQCLHVEIYVGVYKALLIIVRTIPVRGPLHIYDFPYESPYNLLQIGWHYDSLYDEKIERLYAIRIPVQISVRIRIRFGPLELDAISRDKKEKKCFPENKIVSN
jgi:hypothetical protein